MVGAPEEHPEVPGKSGPELFLPPCLFHADICFKSENYDHWYHSNAISDGRL